MKDVDRELRERFAGAEARLTGPDFAPDRAPTSLLHRTRRRQVGVIATTLATVVLVVVGSTVGVSALMRASEDHRVPLEPPVMVTPPVTIAPPPEVERPIKVEAPIAVAAPVALEPAADCPPGSTPDEAGPADQARPPGRTGPMTFDRDSHRIVALIGLRRDEPALAQLWTFDVCTNTWSRMGAGIPLTNSSDDPALVYDPGTDRVVLMGPRWVRTYDDALDAWTLSGAPTDRAGFGPEAFLDPATGRLVVLDETGDLWSYDVAEDQWWRVEQIGETPRSPDLHPQGLMSMQILTYVPAVDRLVQYIGYCGEGEGINGSVATWEFDLRTRTWSQPSTDTPLVTGPYCGWSVPDIGEANAYEEASGRMVVFTPDAFFVYDADAHRWTSVPMDASSTPGPPIEPSDDVVYDPVNERVVVYGDGMWAIDLATRTWTQLLAPSE